ncbi:putative wall-associated receptor kinase, galacturonan-binding domain-containing protein [Helianthus annuus]|nr:putative wall-associated receptor kinase, galacturonan-binding domain-containing protein [Helianthus annuus]
MYLLFVVMCLSHHTFSRGATTNATIALPGCPSKCGSLTVPYPFGIGSGSGCSIGPWFDITCNTSFNPPKAFLPADIFTYKGNLSIDRVEVVDISDEHVRVKNAVAFKCYDQTGNVTSFKPTGITAANSYFTFSQLNNLIAVGCDDYAVISPVAGIEYKNFTVGCVSICSGVQDVPVGSCSGIHVSSKPKKNKF